MGKVIFLFDVEGNLLLLFIVFLFSLCSFLGTLGIILFCEVDGVEESKTLWLFSAFLTFLVISIAWSLVKPSFCKVETKSFVKVRVFWPLVHDAAEFIVDDVGDIVNMIFTKE